MSLANGDLGIELGRATVIPAPDLGKKWYRVSCNTCARSFVAELGLIHCPLCQKPLMVEVTKEEQK